MTPMRISEVINALREIMHEHGDLPVAFHGSDGEEVVWDVAAYDSNGNSPSTKPYNGKVVQAYMHGMTATK